MKDIDLPAYAYVNDDCYIFKKVSKEQKKKVLKSKRTTSHTFLRSKHVSEIIRDFRDVLRLKNDDFFELLTDLPPGQSVPKSLKTEEQVKRILYQQIRNSEWDFKTTYRTAYQLGMSLKEFLKENTEKEFKRVEDFRKRLTKDQSKYKKVREQQEHIFVVIVWDLRGENTKQRVLMVEENNEKNAVKTVEKEYPEYDIKNVFPLHWHSDKDIIHLACI